MIRDFFKKRLCKIRNRVKIYYKNNKTLELKIENL